MGIESLIAIVIVGTIAGWLAGLIVRGGGMGFLTNMAVGVVGAFIASLVLPGLGLSIGGGILAAVLHATFGAVLLLILLRLVRRA